MTDRERARAREKRAVRASASVSVCVYGASESTARAKKKKGQDKIVNRKTQETEREVCVHDAGTPGPATLLRTLHYITLHLRPPPTINDIFPPKAITSYQPTAHGPPSTTTKNLTLLGFGTSEYS